MYIVTIENDGVKTEIHNEARKLASGSVVKGINTIDTFSFTLYPNNLGFDLVREFKTLVTVYNTRRERCEFYGRVLCANPSMDRNGLITKDVTCESYLGFLCDSQQKYVAEKNWTVSELINHIIDTHNAQIEEYKRFKVGLVTVEDKNDNLYLGIQRNNTWDTLNEKLLDRLGGEFRFRVEDDGIYLDYVEQIGTNRQTPIKLSHNMESILKEHDPTEYITRLIPLGSKTGDDTEERVDITSVNNGVEYIDDEEAVEAYGIHVGYKEWDDVTEPANLLAKAREWLIANNRMLVNYTITALDLSLIEIDIDDLDVGNTHPIENELLNINDSSRIIKKTIDVPDETKSTVEVGDVFKNLTDIQIKRDKKIASTEKNLSSIDSRVSGVASGVAENKKLISLKVDEQVVNDLEVRIDSAEVAINANGVSIGAQKTSIDNLTNRVTKAESSIEVNAEGISSKVSKNGVISAINQTSESVVISAKKIDLNGVVKSDLFKGALANVDNLFASTLGCFDLSATNISCAKLKVDGDSAKWKTSPDFVKSVSLKGTSSFAVKDTDGIVHTIYAGYSISTSKDNISYLGD